MSSVVSMLYFMYRLFVREVENVVYRVYEERLKKEIREEVERLYEEKIKKDIQEMLRNPK